MAETAATAAPTARDLRLWRLGRRLLPYARRRWPSLTAVGLGMALDVAMSLLKPWPMKVLVDNVLSGHRLTGTVGTLFRGLPGPANRDALLMWTVLATLVLFLVGWAALVFADLAGVWFGRRITYDLAGDVLTHLQRLSLRYHSRRGGGDLIRRMTTDSACIATIIKDAFLPVAAALLSLLAMAVVMFQLDVLLTLVALAVLPLLVLSIRWTAGPMAERGYDQQTAEGRMYDDVERGLSGISTVQAFSAESRNDDEFRRSTRNALKATVRSTATQLRFKVCVGASTAIGTAAVLWVGAERVLHHSLSLGEVLVFLAYLVSMYGPLETVMYSSSTVQDAAGSLYRVSELLATSPEVVDGPRTLRHAHGGVEFRRVAFGYDPGHLVLDGVSLRARPGERIALVGSTGAGKSTIANLLMRFYDPEQGSVTVDGVDLRDVKVASLRAQIAVVTQDSFLFPISVADNIAYGRPYASRDEVVAAATRANADAFIRELPDGYDTVVGERGATLSGGQRQRVAIARALLKDAPILVLDEPTSALDAETEQLVMDALERLMENRTTLVIAHRLSTVREADRIYVLEHGRVTESGTHTELLARNGHYAELCGYGEIAPHGRHHGRHASPVGGQA